MSKVLIVEDELLVAENISDILQHEGHTICGIADRADEALAVLKAETPDLVVCDIYIKGDKTGIELVKEIIRISSIPVIYLTAFSDQKTIQTAAATVPAAYVVKPFTEKQLLAAVALALAQNSASAGQKLLVPPTRRETEILQLLAKGLSTKQIADQLFLSEHTVQTHRKNLMSKYEVEAATGLIALAVKHKWIEL